MITLLKKIFIDNWPRKLVSIILAIIIWGLVNHSMSSTKTFHKVPIKIKNAPVGKIFEKSITITLNGNKTILDELNKADLEIVIDAKGKGNDWTVYLSPKNIICLNPDIDIQKNITKVIHSSLTIKLSDMTTQKIPIHLTHPIGEAPKGFICLDVWPYQLYVTVNGPTEAVKKLKNKGIKLTFNLNDISEKDLMQIDSRNDSNNEVSFLVPKEWKKISLPSLSSNSFEIDDPQSKLLKIDFTKNELLPIDSPIPITLFYPLKTSNTINPDTYTLDSNEFIQRKNGIKMITEPLFAHGVSRLFLDTVKDMIQVVVITAKNNSKEVPLWNAQFIYPHELEDRFVAKVLANESNTNMESIQPHLREEFIRNKFRNYINRFRIYTPDNKKLSLDIKLDANTVKVTPVK